MRDFGEQQTGDGGIRRRPLNGEVLATSFVTATLLRIRTAVILLATLVVQNPDTLRPLLSAFLYIQT